MKKNNQLNALEAKLESVLAELPPEYKALLGRRYGLGRKRRQALSQVAKSLKLSRQKITWMYDCAIRQLRKPRRWKHLCSYLEWADNCAWTTIAQQIGDSGSIVMRGEAAGATQSYEQIPGAIELLLCVYYGNLRTWLNNTANGNKRAWYRSHYGSTDIDQAITIFQKTLSSHSNVALISVCSANLNGDQKLLHFIMHLIDLDLAVYREFIVVKPLSSEVLRAIRLHLILYHEYRCKPVETDRLINAFNRMYTDDQLTPGMAEQVLAAYPKLFDLAAESVRAIGRYRSAVECLESEVIAADKSENQIAETPVAFFKRPIDDMVSRQIVVEIIEYQGLSTFTEIVNEFKKRIGKHYQAIYAVTIGQALRQIDFLVEPAPGHYCVLPQNGSAFPYKQHYHHLLNKRDCAKFIVHRFAGEPSGIYPMWTPEMEYRWCCWAEDELAKQERADGDNESNIYNKKRLLLSLTSAIEPQHWPVPDEQRNIWNFKKQKHAINHFAKDFKTSDHWKIKFSLQDLLSVSMLAKNLGFMNWLRASFDLLFGRPSLRAAPILMLMVALRMLRAPDHWQKRHELGEEIDPVLDMMALEIKQKGFVHWRDEAGVKIIRQIKQNLPTTAKGWVAAADVRTVLNVIEKKGPLSEDSDRISPPIQMKLPM
jgi:hypothetical protein